MKNFLFLCLFLGFAAANDCSHPDIQNMLNELNKNYPQQVDKVTLITNTSCTNKELTYAYSLLTNDEVPFHKFTDEMIAEFNAKQRQLMRNFICTDPEVTELRNYVDRIVFRYNLEDGRFFTKIAIDFTECKSGL
ncbi:hypothetical protein [Campylobacter suis]|uniref:Uncharacterized protein n=1 Tax=Campylobacter suis TaxID=2790657 RepID=A0ABN7K6P6_9BACT|nr:hypothetical protein [Campylobacter suis]CAD7288136.1 hypothetical protein LMG8286_01155 [Campylobacter suis]